MLNPVIVVAIITQTIIARSSRLAGAVVGLMITTGILLWGISVYSQGNQIALLTIPLSQTVFILACLVWYGIDAREFMIARSGVKAEAMLQDPILDKKPVYEFYQTTRTAWESGEMSDLSRGFELEGKLSMTEFIAKYPPTKGSALRVFFEKFWPRKGEYLVGLGNLKNENNGGWFVLTNLRLVQRDGRDNEFKEVILADVGTYQINDATRALLFKMKSDEEISFEKLELYPVDRFLAFMIPSKTEG